MGIGQELLNVPMGQMIREMAFAIADAQVELDEASMLVAEMMSGRIVERDAEGNPIMEDGKVKTTSSLVQFGTKLKDGKEVADEMSMFELGFSPTFYQFIDTIIEVKIAIKIHRETSYGRQTRSTTKKGKLKWLGYTATTTSVDASYSSKYSYTAEGSSLLRTKLAPVPPPAILEERIRTMIEKKEGT